MKFNKADIITCESYKELCDYVYKVGDEPRPGLVHVNFEEIQSFFEAIKDNGHEYVVVSSCSDYGLCYQANNPPWQDIAKWAQIAQNPSMGYSDICIQARLDANRCKQTDKYSVKCYSHTAYTFNEIPSNVKRWFMTNSSILPKEEPVIEVIPFGVAAKAQDTIYNVSREGHEHGQLVYVNWQNYTFERYFLKETLELRAFPCYTIIKDAKPYEEYLRDLARHKCILSPEGNGIDCYRILESIYMGSVPVVSLSPTTFELSKDMNMAPCRTLFHIGEHSALELYNVYKDRTDNNYAKLSYWKQRFSEEKLRLKWN